MKVFASPGGNLAPAGPDTPYPFGTFQNCELTVQVVIKLNRSHVVHGKQVRRRLDGQCALENTR